MSVETIEIKLSQRSTNEVNILKANGSGITMNSMIQIEVQAIASYFIKAFESLCPELESHYVFKYNNSNLMLTLD